MSPLLQNIVLWGTGALIALFFAWLWWLDIATDLPKKKPPSGFEVKSKTTAGPAARKVGEHDHD
ncbi:MAG TPA: hypothetical protein VGR35_11335 [Tepidisphaeraceae bacterium]|nr:hypothetical protein [Tepidisphaeraceae bacterium]